MLAALRQRVSAWIRPRQSEALPVTLDRHRIYILPTGFGLFIALILGAMLLGALNYNNNPALLLGFLLASTAVLSLHATHLTLSGVRLRAAHALAVHAGEPLLLKLLLESDGARDRNGLVLELDGSRAVVRVVDGLPAHADLVLPTQSRGWMSVGRITVSTTQPLGLARAWAYFWPQPRLLVYPRLEAQAPPLPSHAGMGTRNRVRAQGDELHHLRDYRHGDPPRQIAWKASARGERLLVREYESRSDRVLRLHWDALPGMAIEARISRLARWVVEADRIGARYQLILPSTTLGPAQGHAHRHACLRALALLPHG